MDARRAGLRRGVWRVPASAAFLAHTPAAARRPEVRAPPQQRGQRAARRPRGGGAAGRRPRRRSARAPRWPAAAAAGRARARGLGALVRTGFGSGGSTAIQAKPSPPSTSTEGEPRARPSLCERALASKPRPRLGERRRRAPASTPQRDAGRRSSGIAGATSADTARATCQPPRRQRRDHPERPARDRRSHSLAPRACSFGQGHHREIRSSPTPRTRDVRERWCGRRSRFAVRKAVRDEQGDVHVQERPGGCTRRARTRSRRGSRVRSTVNAASLAPVLAPVRDCRRLPSKACERRIATAAPSLGGCASFRSGWIRSSPRARAASPPSACGAPQNPRPRRPPPSADPHGRVVAGRVGTRSAPGGLDQSRDATMPRRHGWRTRPSRRPSRRRRRTAARGLRAAVGGGDAAGGGRRREGAAAAVGGVSERAVRLVRTDGAWGADVWRGERTMARGASEGRRFFSNERTRAERVTRLFVSRTVRVA